jgi:hypothetical protein
MYLDSISTRHNANPQAPCFRGIPKVSKDRDIRIRAIAAELACNKYDIVCLQEVWKNDDFELIKSVVFEALPYAHYFYR